MKVHEILRRINQSLGDEMYTINEVQMALDSAVDYINDEMSTSFPYLQPSSDVYEGIPDLYIRTVLIPFAVAEMLDYDEEISNVWKFKAQDNVFKMFRDYKVPEEYIVDDTGYLETTLFENKGGLVWRGNFHF